MLSFPYFLVDVCNIRSRSVYVRLGGYRNTEYIPLWDFEISGVFWAKHLYEFDLYDSQTTSRENYHFKASYTTLRSSTSSTSHQAS